MPEERQFSSLPDTDIWHAHKSIIRRLYVEEKRTLKKVKEIMELEHGFPSFPLTTYGTKLRDQLKLPKKLKKKDWPVIYQHYRHRQADGKQTSMYLNDTSIPWEKAWKEIRRYRVPLDPTGIWFTSPLRLQFLIAHSYLHHHITTGFSAVWTSKLPDRTKHCLMCLEDTPWFTLKTTLLEQIQLKFSDTLDQFALITPVSALSELRTQGNISHKLALAAYIISNNLLNWLPYDAKNELFDFLLTCIHQRLALDLFHSPLLSVQAIWDIMGQNIHIIERQDVFVSWMKLGFSRPAQIVRYGHHYLSKAVSMGCIDIVRSLLKIGIRADDEMPRDYTSLEQNRRKKHWSAIYEAIASQDTKCLELLLEFCDVNRTIMNIKEIGFSSFTLVLSSMGNFFKDWADISWKLQMHQPSLKIMLEHGANVDLPCPEFLDLRETMRFFQDNKLLYTSPSILEYCYYYDKQMYYQLVPFSSRPAQSLYRDEICLVAAMGHSTLLDYFTSKPCVNPLVLGSVLAEHFFLGDKHFDSAVVRALLEFGVTINTPTPEKCFTTLLRLFMRKARNMGFNENDVYIMKALLSSGALLNSEVVAAAVADEGIGALELISALGANFRHEGAHALCRAARLNNFVAVSWLLKKEVNINTAIEETHLPLELADSVSIVVAAVIQRESDIYPSLDEDVAWDWGESADCIMLQFLLDHGAKLWAGSPDTSPFEALRVILYNSYEDPHLFEKVQIMINHGMDLRELPRLGLHLLEASLRYGDYWIETEPRPKIFKLLREHGAPAFPGAVLTRLMDCPAPRQLVLDLIDSGADITAYAKTVRGAGYYDPIQIASLWRDRSLVLALLEHGANINSPALGWGGRTPLQAACGVASEDEESNRKQMDFVRFLLLHNADVNAPAGAINGFTALQLAAHTGNLQLLSLLLSHGALVNTPNHWCYRCALDFAAECGRLDALHFLLKAGALSYCHGQSGYEGAIRLAKKGGFSVLADSLNEHVRKNEILFREQPTLAAAHCAAMKDRDWTDDMFSDEDYTYYQDPEEVGELAC
ncbi:hypothetical protein FHL15_004989 [Xylaria flabelliformis]|uniref:Clr5 domain-containing protein n=1 Tax=Xylaria flabelliformis TaxID=2512241 RepID=A0A553I1Z5_9PEZI|nr:hypothetical protein FHL15_004989 [Xylaria flabelliformis]